MHTFQRRITITPLAIRGPEHSDLNHLRPLGDTPVLPNKFSRCTQGRSCPKPGTHFTAE